MNHTADFKTAVIQGIKEMTKSNLSNAFSDIDDFQVANSAEIFSNTEFAKNIKEYIEKALENQLENKLSEISDIHKMTWKIDAHNIAKDVLESHKVSSIKLNLDNILENCVKQICFEMRGVSILERTKESHIYFPLTNAEYSMQPIQSKFSELSQFTSNTKPVDTRIKAYELLISSYYADTVTKTTWTELQKTIQEGLNDNNMDIFKLSLKLQAKLLSCSSFEIVKDTFLNLLETLCKQYNEQDSEYEIISLSNSKQFRMISIVKLIINAVKAITQNVARFGLKRLEEIIDNLVHLVSVHYCSKFIKRKRFVSPFEIISCLDPMGNWCVFLTHGVATRNILLNSNSNSSRISLLQMIVEELNAWFLKPFIPDDVNVDLNAISVSHVKYAVFIHSLSLFVTICRYEMGRAFFPLLINKNEECLTISAMTEKVILFLNERIKKEKELNKKFSNSFVDFVVNCAKTLFSISENQTTVLQVVTSPVQQIPPHLFSHTLDILDLLERCECDKHLFMKNLTLGRKRGTQLSIVSVSAHCFQNKRYRSPLEQHNILPSSICTFDTLTNILIKILENKNFKYSTYLVSQLINIFGKYLIQNNGLWSIISKDNKYNIIHLLAVTFNRDKENDVIRIEDSNVSRACQNFFLQIGATPLGSHLTKEEKVLASVLQEVLEAPHIPWTCAEWRLFMCYCCQYIRETSVLATQNTSLVKQQLLKLWEVIDTDCSGSNLDIQQGILNFLTVIASFGFSLNGVSAMFAEPADGSDVTLTEMTDLRPTTVATLVQHFALSMDDIYDMVFHQVALSVLHIFVSNLDTNLYLQHTLQFQDYLLQLQSENRVDESSEVMIDECSTLRHTILEQCYFPRHTRTDIKLYCTPSQATSTLHRVKVKPRFNGELTKFLQDTKTCLRDMNWLKQARKAYRASTGDDIKGATLAETVEQVKKCLPDVNNKIKWATAEVAEEVYLFPEELLGIQFVIRYGVYHRLLQPTPQNADNLHQLLRLVKASLGSQLDTFSGFDWFLASVFLICAGNIERCQSFLSCVTSLPTANFVWPSLTSNENRSFVILGQLIDSILANELPCAFYTLQHNGISWWLICQQWIRECFWNTLDWNQVCHWLMLCILQQPEYVIYFCVALLHVNEKYILNLSRENNVYQVIVSPVCKFQMADTFPLMDKLCKRYHNVVNTKLNVPL